MQWIRSGMRFAADLINSRDSYELLLVALALTLCVVLYLSFSGRWGR